MSIKQGDKYNNSKMNIIQQGFTSGRREGFVGILGSNNDMDQVITSDTATTIEGTDQFNDYVTRYGQDYKTLREKTTEYIKSPQTERLLKNYNVFVNKAITPKDNQKGCVTTSSISNLSLADGFADAYPDNFTQYEDSKNACKLWAAYDDKTTFAINKGMDGKYKCFTGDGLNATLTPKTKPLIVYTVLDGDATSLQGGLFGNGQIGVWSGSIGGPDWDITKMKKPMMIKKYNSQSYSSSDPAYLQVAGGGGWGWWGNCVPGTRDNWGINLFPNSIAWWIGNIPTENVSTASISYWSTSGPSYFYYVYNNSTAQNVYIYYLCENRRGDGIKINGTTLTTTEIPKTAVTYNAVGGNGWEGTTAIPVGNVVFEIKLPTGLPNSGFVFYVATANKSSVLFKSGDPGWGVTTTPAPNYTFLTSGLGTMDPISIKTLNPVPVGYEKCHSLIGGGIMKGSVKATFGKNCSNFTKPPLNIRYVEVRSNPYGDYLQISQIVVNALVDGSPLNVAPGKIVTASPAAGSTRAENAIDGVQAARSFISSRGACYHSTGGINNFWKLDLGQLYPVVEIIYYNRTDCCSERAKGMKIKLSTDGVNTLKTFKLTGALEQKFNVSE